MIQETVHEQLTHIEKVTKLAAEIIRWFVNTSDHEVKQIMVFKSLIKRRYNRSKRIRRDKSKARNREIEKAKGGGGFK